MNQERVPSSFASTAGGTIAAGSRRLGLLLSALGLVMLIAALGAWLAGRVFPGLLALAVVGLIALAWRMSNDLRPQRLRLEPGKLVIETPSRWIDVPIEGASIRALEDEEIQHLEGLASVGGIVAGSGGFDSRLLGEFDLYASNLRHALFVQGLGTRLVITPDQPAEFVTCFRQMAASPLLQSSAHE